MLAELATDRYREDTVLAVDQYEAIAENVELHGQISTAQWVILVVTHLPLLWLWMHAALRAFEHTSIATGWVSRVCGGTGDNDEGDDDDNGGGVGSGYSRLHLSQPHSRASSRTALPEQLPYVCIQLPVFNEAALVRRAIDAACLLRWPRDLLEIQVLDDSTDEECRAVIDAAATTWRERGLVCNVVRRSHRRGYKAGALEAGRQKSPADFFTVLDTDCIPPTDYLERVVPHFYAAGGEMLPDLAMVQTRWGFLNYDDGVLTMAQSLRLEVHRVVASRALSRTVGCVVATGAGATWNARAVAATGGWDATALLESTDLALRAYCAGFYSRFLPHTVVMTELPGTFAAYTEQQERWSQGWGQMVRRHGLDLLDLHARPLWHRWTLLAAVMGESMWPLTLVWMLLLPALVSRGAGWWLGEDAGGGNSEVMPRAMALLAYSAPWVLLAGADTLAAATLIPAPPLLLKRRHVALVRLLRLVPYVVVQTGMMAVHASSFVLGMCAAHAQFERTPKGSSGGGDMESARYGGGGPGGGDRRTGNRSGSDGSESARERTREMSVHSPTRSASMSAGKSGHPFEAQQRWQRQEVTDDVAPLGPAQLGSDIDMLTHDGDVASSSASNNPGSTCTSRRMATLAMEVMLTLALLRLSFAVAASDGWRTPAIVCSLQAACVAYVTVHTWSDTLYSQPASGVPSRWTRRHLSPGESSPPMRDMESLLGHVSKEGYGGLDAGGTTGRGNDGEVGASPAPGPARGSGLAPSRGIYDRVRASVAPQVAPGPQGPGGVERTGVRGGSWHGNPASAQDAHTRAAIKQYRRYRAKEFDLDNISVRSSDSTAYSDGVSAFGGRGGRGGFGSVVGSDFEGGSEAGSELASELSHSVFADAPPALLSSTQLQHHYAGADLRHTKCGVESENEGGGSPGALEGKSILEREEEETQG
jgi:hypothetical protein